MSTTYEIAMKVKNEIPTGTVSVTRLMGAE